MPLNFQRAISYLAPCVSKLSIRTTSSASSTSKLPIGLKPGYSSLDWQNYYHTHYSLANFNIVTFNLLAPCYKRMTTRNILSGHRHRESDYPDIWRKRRDDTLMFMKEHVFASCSIVALQEYWLEKEYSSHFEDVLGMYAYELVTLQRTGQKMDAVALAIKKDVFTIMGQKNISLGSGGDRVALLLWLKHNDTKKDILVAATHLSFPHSAIDRIGQMRQMRRLTYNIDHFAIEHHINHATRIVLGDFNVEGDSPVCDHLRSEGYHSCAEVTPPKNIHQPTAMTKLRQESGRHPHHDDHHTSLSEVHDVDFKICRLPSKSTHHTTSIEHHHHDDYNDDHQHFLKMNEAAPVNRYMVKFVSHHTHRAEDLGVDHIFIKPEYEYMAQLQPPTSSSSSSEKMICEGGMFVDGTEIVPHHITSQAWETSFYVSDHRPFGACIVIGRKQPINNIDYDRHDI